MIHPTQIGFLGLLLQFPDVCRLMSLGTKFGEMEKSPIFHQLANHLPGLLQDLHGFRSIATCTEAALWRIVTSWQHQWRRTRGTGYPNQPTNNS